MECYPRPDSKGKFKTTKDLDTAHVLHDSELFFRSHEDLDEEPGPRTFRTCYRHVSWNLWCKGHTVHVDDIVVKTPGYYTMLPELWDHTAGKFTLRNLIAVCPVLSNSRDHDGDVVYLVSKVSKYGKEAWVVALDLRKKTVEVLKPYHVFYQNSFLACTFPGYLNTTPRSCAPEDQNYSLNGHLSPGNIIQNNLQNMHIVHPVDSFQLQPQLVVPLHCFPQTPRYKFIPTGPAVPFNTLMPPVPAYPAMPFNTLMPPVPMDEGFLSQVSPVPVSPAAPCNTMMPLVLTDDRLLSHRCLRCPHHSLP